MNHGGCCNCFICNIGKFLGLVEPCGDNCCKTEKPKTKIVSKKSTVKKKVSPKNKRK